MRPVNFSHRQRGVVMFTALIMMVLMLLVAISSFNMGRQNTVIAGNMQNRAEAISSANQAVEQVLSTTDFVIDPTAALPGNQASYDVNGDGTDDILVLLNPQPCIKKTQPVPNDELEIWLDIDCDAPASGTPAVGMDPATCNAHKDNAQLCSDGKCIDAVWEVNAVATDAVTGAATTVTRGVGVRMALSVAPIAGVGGNFCP